MVATVSDWRCNLWLCLCRTDTNTDTQTQTHRQRHTDRDRHRYTHTMLIHDDANSSARAARKFFNIHAFFLIGFL